MVVAARGWVAGGKGRQEERDVGERVHAFSYQMNAFWASKVQHGDYS